MNDPLIGRVLSRRFQIVSFIREGGMASIYCGAQQAIPHHVALKIMHPELARDPKFVRRFRREARAAARLRHPNVVEIIEFGDDREIVYIAMELVVGNDLLIPLTRDGPFPEARAANVIIQVCDALSCAHAQNVVHRDLKPENVMVLTDRADPTIEHIKVLDFGIAKILDDQPDAAVLDPNRETPSSVRSMLTRVGMIVGTPAYMSPEQGRAEPVDLRTDIYSAGVLLYELLTGLPPFDGETPMQVVMRHVNESPKPPSAVMPIHPGLEALVMRALSKWPRDRFQSAATMAAELRRLMPELATVGRTVQSSKIYSEFADPGDDEVDSIVHTAVNGSQGAGPISDEDDEAATFIKAPSASEEAEESVPDSVPNPNPGMPTITFSMSDLNEAIDDAGAISAPDLPSPTPRVLVPTPISPLPPPSAAAAPTPRTAVGQTAKMLRSEVPREDGNGAAAPLPLRPSAPPIKVGETLGRSWEPAARPADRPAADRPRTSAPPTGSAATPAPLDFYADPRTRKLLAIAIALGVGLLVAMVALIGVLVALLTR